MANLMTRREPRGIGPGAGLLSFDPFRMMREMWRWDPFRELGETALALERERVYTPDFDVKETKEAFVIRADLPGIQQSDLDISLSANRLTVSGKRESEERQEGETWHAVECSYGAFSRSFTLPEGVDENNVRADLEHGVLTMTLPKRPELQAKHIEIKANGSKKKP